MIVLVLEEGKWRIYADYKSVSKEAREGPRGKKRRSDISGCPQKRGVCLIVRTQTPKKPNSALAENRSCAFDQRQRSDGVHTRCRP